MIFKRYDPDRTSLVRATAEGADQQVIATGQENNPFHNYQWSPDGRSIVYTKWHRNSTGLKWSMVEVPAGGGPEKALTEAQATAVRELHWLGPHDMLASISILDTESGSRPLWFRRCG
jgi:Tol biopolymer transport system component